jgi:hypothetical protein
MILNEQPVPDILTIAIAGNGLSVKALIIINGINFSGIEMDRSCSNTLL